MKKTALLVCMTLLVLGLSSPIFAFTIYDPDLGDTTNFVAHGGNGVLNSRTDIAGNPGYRFNITFSGSGWQDIQIGDNFDLPSNNAGLTVAGIGSLSSSDSYTMTIKNPNTSGSFMATLYLNSGWTDSPYSEINNYYQSGWVWLLPGQTATLNLNLSTVLNLSHISDIGFKIGSNIGTGDYYMPSGTPFNVEVVPIPAAAWLLGTGIVGLVAIRRKFRK